MKHALLAFALLLTSAFAHAGSQTVNFADPQMQTGAKKDCWKQHATGGDTSQARPIHADSRSMPENKVDARARALSAT